MDLRDHSLIHTHPAFMLLHVLEQPLPTEPDIVYQRNPATRKVEIKGGTVEKLIQRLYDNEKVGSGSLSHLFLPPST